MSTTFNKEEIIKIIAQNTANTIHAATYLFNEESFFETRNGKWTVAENMQHLSLSAKPLVLAFGLPKFIPALLFGKNKTGSKNYEELIASYQSKLDMGAKATGAYIPKTIAIPKNKLIHNFQKMYQNLAVKLESWKEKDLDVYQLPHPIIGKITIREMMYFTLYHQTIHLKTINGYADLSE